MQPNLKTLSLFTLAGGLLSLAIVFGHTDKEQPKPSPDPKPDPIVQTGDGPVVQIALLLDTSSSMDGLIDQAKSQLWKIVNDVRSRAPRRQATAARDRALRVRQRSPLG